MTIFESSFQKTNLWLKDVEASLRTDDRAKAYAALRTVLHVLRECITVEECAKFSAQLPLILTGVFFDGWKPRRKPARLGKSGFFHELRDRLKGEDPGTAARAVFRALEKHMSSGEIDHLRSVLPRGVRELWLELSLSDAPSLERDFEPIQYEAMHAWQPGWAARQLGEQSGGVPDLGLQD